MLPFLAFVVVLFVNWSMNALLVNWCVGSIAWTQPTFQSCHLRSLTSPSSLTPHWNLSLILFITNVLFFLLYVLRWYHCLPVVEFRQVLKMDIMWFGSYICSVGADVSEIVIGGLSILPTFYGPVFKCLCFPWTRQFTLHRVTLLQAPISIACATLPNMATLQAVYMVGCPQSRLGQFERPSAS